MALFRLKNSASKDSHKCQTTIFLNGGLGNQLFQFAFGVEISRIRNSTIFLDTSFLDRDHKRNFALEMFGLPPNKSFEISGLEIMMVDKEDECNCEPYEIRETDFFFSDFSSEIVKKGQLSVHGYWQSQKYFEESREVVRTLIVSKLKANLNKKYGVIHIRRGDFMNDPHTRSFHGLLGVHYYMKACRLIPRDVKAVYLISDDVIEANKIGIELSRSFPELEFSLYEGAPSEIDCLSLMAKSDFIVTANSSFSWWGSWISTASFIVAPRNYFTQEISRLNNLIDLYPENWYLA
jgi:hypothetical protein